jgi:hypothetical protein
MARATAGVDPAAIVRTVAASPVLRTRIDDPAKLEVAQTAAAPRGARRAAAAPVGTTAPTGIMIATQTVIAEGLKQSDFAAAKNYGAQIVDEGFDGKTLLKTDSVERAFGLVELLRDLDMAYSDLGADPEAPVTVAAVPGAWLPVSTATFSPSLSYRAPASTIRSCNTAVRRR